MKPVAAILWSLVFCLLAGFSPAGAADLDAKVSAEIEHLIGFVQTSGCQFKRNGSLYEPEEAASHIRRKYDYAYERGGIASAEDFVKYAATESSWSGKRYTVECPGNDPVYSSDWLIAELSRFRASR